MHKGTDVEKDAYSALDGTNVLETLREKGVRRVWVGGLAQDVCVRATVLDACAAGFEVHVLLAATRPVDPEEGRRAIDEMRAAGAIIEEGDHGP